MVMITDSNGVERYSLDKTIYKMLLRAKQKVTEEDQEVWFGLGGDTGTGKSVLAQHWLHSVFKGLAIEQVCFDKDEFIKAVLEAKRGTGIIGDEGIAIAFSRGAMTREGKIIAELINQIRQKNLIIFMCCPNVLNLDETVRQKLDVYVHIWENRQRINGKMYTLKGNADVYPEFRGGIPFRTQIIQYFKAKRSNPLKFITKPTPYIRIKGTPIGDNRAKPWYPVGEEPYRTKKEAILKKYLKTDKKTNPRETKTQLERDAFMNELHNEFHVPQVELCKIATMPKQTVNTAIHRNKGGVPF